MFAKHSLLGGEEPEDVAAEIPNAVHIKSPIDMDSESHNIAKFETKITMALPSLGAWPIDEANIHESRDIAHFDNIHIIKKQSIKSQEGTLHSIAS